MANPFPFVSGSVLLASELNGIGEAAVTFTPTFSNYTRGNGTSVAFHMRVNKLVYVYVEETLGSTSAVTGGPTLTLPFAATRFTAIQMGRSRIDDIGANVFFGTTIGINTTQVVVFADIASASFVSFGSITSTVPMTWATTDKFTLQFVYEAA